MEKIPANKIGEMREALSTLQPKEPTKLPAREVVGKLAEEMRAALKRGVTPSDIIDALKPLGLDISPSTLASYLRELDGNKKARKSGKRTAHQAGAERTSPAPVATRATEIGAAPSEAVGLTNKGTSEAPTNANATPGATMYRPVGG